jgi:hypothetical protein
MRTSAWEGWTSENRARGARTSTWEEQTVCRLENQRYGRLENLRYALARSLGLTFDWINLYQWFRIYTVNGSIGRPKDFPYHRVSKRWLDNRI